MTAQESPPGDQPPAPLTATLPDLVLLAETEALHALATGLRDFCRRGLRCSGEVGFALGVSSIWALAYNQVFWGQVVSAMWHPALRSIGFIASLGVLLITVQSTVLLLAPTERLMRTLASALFVVAAVSAYFIGAYGAVLNPDMMRNVLQTDAAEMGGLVNHSMLLHVVLLGVLPATLVWRVRWPTVPRGVRLRRRILFLAAAWPLAFLGMIGTSASYAVMLRQHKPIRYAALPVAPLINTARLLAREWSDIRPGPLIDHGGPARRVGKAHMRPLVVLLVVGESARAASFELGGYMRPTNPRLSGIGDLLYFDHAQACGTSTTISVQCMFSPLGRDRFDANAARNYANLLDALQRAGVDVEWWDNNSGCKGVCARVPTIKYAARRTEAMCPESYCYDEVMLEDLRRRLIDVQRDTVIVYHQIGSHGPAYFERYPPRFEKFRPSCRSSELNRCTTEEVRNSYDNTILYSDYVLSRQIEILSAVQDRLDTALLYVSDHGESLGEQGLYLHGMPYSLAPRTQTDVPLLVWLPKASLVRLELDGGCLQNRLHEPVSHDDLYHTMLALTGLRNDYYEPELDLLAPCTPQGVKATASTVTPPATVAAAGHAAATQARVTRP